MPKPPPQLRHPRPPARGMTLVEVMVVLAILAIITALAWPTYQETVRKGRRSDAMGALARAMQAQERLRSNSATYEADITKLGGSASPAGYYTLSVAANSATATGYTLLANVTSNQAQAQDSRCAVFRVVVNGGSIRYESADSAGTNNAPDPCWVK